MERSMEVQEAVEACCKNIGSKLLFVGTGQTAVTGTPNLKRLEGRFTIRIELSDADVDVVIRQVILAKKPDAIGPIEKMMESNLGEISRQGLQSGTGRMTPLSLPKIIPSFRFGGVFGKTHCVCLTLPELRVSSATSSVWFTK